MSIITLSSFWNGTYVGCRFFLDFESRVDNQKNAVDSINTSNIARKRSRLAEDTRERIVSRNCEYLLYLSPCEAVLNTYWF